MKKNPRIWEPSPQPQWSVEEQRRWKVIAMGHVCQKCRSNILMSENMCLVYFVKPSLFNLQKYGSRIYVRANWTICCNECAKRIAVAAEEPFAKAGHVNKMLLASSSQGRGRTKALPYKKGDGYREKAMKDCGIDPNLHVGFKVYMSNDFTGMFLEAIEELKRG